MRTQNSRFRLVATAALSALLLAQALPQPVLAQGAPPAPQTGAQDQQGADPPTRVGRLALLNGTVSFHTQDDSQWSRATLNYPVSQGYALWTNADGQAVIEVSASRIAMAPGTELDVATLTDTALQATEPQGELYLRVRAATQAETYAVQTPRGLVTLTAPGRYGVVAGDTQNPTTITVIDGAAHVEGPGVSLDVHADQTARITGSDTFTAEAGPAQRDAFLTAMLDSERPPQPQGVAPPAAVATMPGGEDLTQYGSWIESPQYGRVWYPQVAPDWVPYRAGNWAYVAPWGWTWVDSAPWGFAPFHYGRWVEIGGRWAWVPGGAVDTPAPVYAPALVTFFGAGAAVGLGIGAALAEGRIGWAPLGPREPFHPWYRASDRYLRQVNMPHIGDFATVNRNATFDTLVNRHAATVVPTGAMIGSRPVAGSFVRVDPAQLAQTRIVAGQAPPRPAPTTMGVTPAVARQLNLGTPSPGLHTGVAAGSIAGPLTPPALRNPAQPVLPSAAGAIHPFATPPPLRTPGQIGPPAVQHEPGFVGQGPVSHLPPLVNHESGGAMPATISHPPPQFHTAPGATFQQTQPPAAVHVPPPSPPVVHAQPPVVFHAQQPPPMVHAAPPVTNPSPPTLHAAAPPTPQFHASPPPALHAAAPPAPQFHAPSPPPVAHTPPPSQNSQHKRPGEP